MKREWATYSATHVLAYSRPQYTEVVGSHKAGVALGRNSLEPILPIMQVSGKIVILGIVAFALSAAGASWWFRYNATRRAAEFWGPAAVRLIRDAPIVEIYRLSGVTDSAMSEFDDKTINTAKATDISHAPGITHLRNALLEDRSYAWPARAAPPDMPWRWMIFFRNDDERLRLLFSPDWKFVRRALNGEVLSTEPIAEGLATMLAPHAARTPPANRPPAR